MYKRHLLQIAVTVFAIILMGFSAWAVPGTINYQGKLTDPNGVSMDGFYIMEFYLYNTESGGSHLWNEQQNITVTNGVYNVELGKTNVFPSNIFDNENLYLEVRIFSSSTGWETLSPRQRLTSTPYAMKAGYASTAGDADTLDGLHTPDLFNTGDDYGRSGVAANLYEGTTTLTNKYVNEGQAGSITNGMIVNNAVTSNKIADGAVGASDLSGNAVNSAKIQDGTIQQSDLSFSLPDKHSLDAADGAPVDAIYVDNSGNVGIGTTAPGNSLHIDDGGTDDDAVLHLTGRRRSANYNNSTVIFDAPRSGSTDGSTIGGRGMITVPGRSDSIEGLLFLNTATAGLDPAADIAELRGLQSGLELSSAGILNFWRSGTNYARINGTGVSFFNGGNVGIGTTDPQLKLDVRGGITTSDGIELTAQRSGNRYSYIDFHGDDTYDDYGLRIIRLNTGKDAESQIHHRGSGILSLYTTELDSHIVLYPINGNVGIGTQSPAARLHVTRENMDTRAFIRASNFNPVPTAYWPDFDQTAPYLIRNALWVGWDDSKKAWKYTRESDNDRGITDPGDPATWVVNGGSTGYFDGDLDSLPPGTHINNRYNPRMMAARCNQDDIQVKVGSFWMDKYACLIIDVGPDCTGTTWKDDTADMTTSANTDVPPYWMAFSQKARASTGMTWFVAAQASVNAGKRMPDNAEWQAAALGTSRSSGSGIINGSDWSTVPDQDVSRYGVIGMAGNLWEWVADWIQAGMTWQSSDGQSASPWPSGKGYGDDQTWDINGRAYNGSSYTNGAPAAPLRGGHWGSASYAGVFALRADGAPSHWSSHIGFRSTR